MVNIVTKKIVGKEDREEVSNMLYLSPDYGQY